MPAAMEEDVRYMRRAIDLARVAADAAQQACPTDKVVWLNWSAPAYHLTTERWHRNTEQGAFACLGQTTQLGIPQGA